MTIDEHQTLQFEEAYYLAQYPDVANAVKGGNFRSGLDHYLIVGRAEGRIPGRISGSPHQANTATMQTLEIHPTTADGKSLEDLLIFAVKKRFEPLLQQYLESNSTTVIDNMAPRIREMMDETLPTLLEQAIQKELERITIAQGVTR